MLFSRTENPYTGLAASAVTSNPVFLGDACQMTWSLTTSSTTASRWTLLGNNGDGFFAALADADWFPIAPVTAQGIYSIDSGGALSGLPRWIELQRTPSASSISFVVAFLVRS